MSRLLLVKLLEDGARPLSAPQKPGDVGYDMFLLGDHSLEPGESRDLPTGVAIALDNAVYGRITGRSSSIRRGILVSEGIIDSGYRGPLFAYVTNLSGEIMTLKDGERIAQLVLAWAVRMPSMVVDTLPGSARGADGLGSTGV